MPVPTLKLTYEELVEIMSDDFDRFRVIFDDIPPMHPDYVAEPGDRSSNYIEDDGRQLRSFEFVDTETGIEYSFSYIYHRDWRTEFPCSFLGDPPAGIEFVNEEKDSTLFTPVVLIPVPEPELTPAEAQDKALWAEYKAIEHETTPFDNAKKKLVSVADIEDIVTYTKTPGLRMDVLRSKILPLCIKHRIEQLSFFRYIQSKR